MFRNKEKFIAESDSPVLATFFLSAYEKSRENVKAITNRKNKTYTSIISASNDGCSRKALQPAFQSAINEACYEAAAVDTTNSKDRLLDEAMRNQIRAYLQPN